MTLLAIIILGVLAPPSALEQAQAATAKRDFKGAVEILEKALAEHPKDAELHYGHGRALFRTGRVKAASKAFDRHVELVPQRESRQWERGISHYYAKRYRDGAKQFELYQTFHNSDVENSVWRFLCMVPTEGVKKSRAAMLPIQGDPRPGMMKIYGLFRGTATEAEIWEELAAEGLPNTLKESGTFYAHLYLGLFYEVQGKQKLARGHIEKAADKKYLKNPRVNSYMWDVARIHRSSMAVPK